MDAVDTTSAAAAPRRRPARVMRLLLAFAVLAAAGYAAVLALMWSQQERLLFHPLPLAPGVSLGDGGADVQERFVEVDGARLSVLELRQPDPKGVVLFLHGNAGNLRTWFTDGSFYRRAGYDLVMPDYRGYGRSSGRIQSEAQLLADVEAVWASVRERYAGRKVVVYGRSLGSGPAAWLATRIRPDLTVLVSPFSSLRALTGELYPWVPAALLRYPLRNDERVPAIPGALLLVHGTDDALIPPEHSRRLQRLAPRARLALIEGAGHGDIHAHEAYRQLLRQALAEL